MNMGERLRALRLQRKISQEEVARHIGITRSAYSHYEINNRQPVYETMIKLAAYFNVSLDYIIGGTSPPPGHPVSSDDRELLSLLQDMSQEQREKSINLITDLMRQHHRADSGG